MLKRILLSACCIFALAAASEVSAQQPSQMNAAAVPYVMFDSAPGAFQLAKDGISARILVDANDWAGVIRAAKDLGDDVGKVTGKASEVVTTAGTIERGSVVVGTIGKSKFIDSLVANKKIDVSKIKGQWESFLIQTVDGCLVVAGSDKRGTIFGIYDISEKIGVSPWYWWADVPAKKHDSLFIVPGTFLQGPPKVKYRGIFINDEEPAFGPWSRAKFGGINSKMYVHMFELILRLKGNYMWPAMWGKAFNEDDPENPRLADEYGIVMGTSHHEPMMRNQEEWTKRNRGNRLGAWNYNTNKENLYNFWKEGITRNAKYDNLVTVGMRGDGDEPMAGRGSKMEDNIKILTNVINDQRELIAEAYGKPASEVPQMWAIYKEVQDYYDSGMRVPDDVTILWCDDNWGNVRRLPTPEERKRSGGAGMYYHVDYVGGPHSYRWLNVSPVPKLWEQLNLTYRWGADRLWILNTGDLKPMEIPIDFVLKFAYDPDAIPQDKIGEYMVNWAKEQFGDEYAEEIADIVSKYAKYNGWRKPEILDANTFSVVNDREADDVVDAWLKLVDRAEALKKKMPAEYQDAYFELVYHPVKASAQVAELQVCVGKNRLYARQGRASANEFAHFARELFKEDQKLADVYNKEIAGGKWIHMMDQPHIGTSQNGWDTPNSNQMPRLTELTVPDVSEIGVAVENNENAWPASQEELMLPVFDSWNPVKHVFEVFRRGSQEAKFTVKTTEPWIKADVSEGVASVIDTPVFVDIDWAAAKNGTNTGYIEVTGPNGTAKIRVAAVKADAPAAKNGVKAVWGALAGPISIPAGKPAKVNAVGDVTWKLIPDYGRADGGMCVFPVNADSVTDYTKAPSMEYPIYISAPGKYDITLYTSPTLNFVPDRGLRVAVGIDDAKPAVIDAYGNVQRTSYRQAFESGGTNWDQNVKENIRRIKTQLDVTDAGAHTLKVYMVDPAVVVEKIVISSGRLPQTYFGPKFTNEVKTK